MTGPAIPPMAIAGLRVITEDGLVHEARQRTTPEVLLANGETIKGRPILGPAIPALLAKPTSEQRQIAAAAGIKAVWALQVPQGEVIRVGQVWVVTGESADGDEWTQTVEITGDLVKLGLVTRVVAATDTELNR